MTEQLALNELRNRNFIGLVELMRLAHHGVDLSPLGQVLIQKTIDNPFDAYALLDLSTVLQLRGNRDLALQIQAQAIELKREYIVPNDSPTNLRVLALLSAGDLMANTPIEFLLENSIIELTQFFVTEDLFTVAGAFNEDLPEHDVLFVAIAESEVNLSLLKQLTPLLAKWPKPVFNKPERIALMSRDGACALLENASGIAMPTTIRYALNTIEPQAFSYPIIIRPVDSHAGHDLDKVENAEALQHYLDRQHYDEFFIAPFVDYKNSDGLYRKYRVILCAGDAFLCHLAMSTHWMIHYLNAGMADDAQKRAEEAQAMNEFKQTFAKKHAIAFQAIYERTGLDYVGIDCSETPDGKLLIFEIDSCMIVHAIDPVDLFPYKPEHMKTLFNAFEMMLKKATRE
jgi:glutathione synthase/RimK-type ligase-like ATP-grasp enzyme